MTGTPLLFPSLAAAIAALHHIGEPMAPKRFASDPAETVVIDVNAAAAANPWTPAPGEHPDARRDRHLTADIELEFLYRLLVERNYARQVLSRDGGALYELTVRRVAIAGDNAVYGFVSAMPKADPSGSG